MSSTVDAATDNKLPAFMDISTAETLQRFLQKKLADANGEEIILFGNEVARITTPAIQLLFAAAKTALKEGKGFHLANPSESIKRSFEELGLKKELEKLA